MFNLNNEIRKQQLEIIEALKKQARKSGSKEKLEKINIKDDYESILKNLIIIESSLEEKLDDCEECNCLNPDITEDYVTGQIVCRNCGIVTGIVMVNQEARAFDNKQVAKNKRTSPKTSVCGPRTIIGTVNKDASGHSIQNTKITTTLNKIQNSFVTSLEHNYSVSTHEFKKLKEDYNSLIMESAWRIYQKTAKLKLTMGRSINNFIATSVYAATKILGLPMIQKDYKPLMKLLTNVKEKNLMAMLSVNLQIFIKNKIVKSSEIKRLRLEDYINKYATQLKIHPELIKKTLDYGRIVNNENELTNGKNPAGILAGIIYYVIRKHGTQIYDKISNARDYYWNKNQKAISEFFGITEMTLRARVKDLTIKLSLNQILNQYRIRPEHEQNIKTEAMNLIKDQKIFKERELYDALRKTAVKYLKK